MGESGKSCRAATVPQDVRRSRSHHATSAGPLAADWVSVSRRRGGRWFDDFVGAGHAVAALRISEKDYSVLTRIRFAVADAPFAMTSAVQRQDCTAGRCKDAPQGPGSPSSASQYGRLTPNRRA